jgi:hypothetical protein
MLGKTSHMAVLSLRKGDDEHCPIILDRLGRYITPMGFDDRSGDGQAQTRLATLLARLIAPVKAIEDVR